MQIIIESQFFPPVESFVYFARAEKIWIEACENYQKRSYRNRCTFLNHSGRYLFSVPLEKGKNQQTPISQVNISYEQDWVSQFKKHLQSSYGNSPFYSFYENEMFKLLKRNIPELFELNNAILRFLFKILQWDKEIFNTRDFLKSYPKEYCDLRNNFSPLNKGIGFKGAHMKYPQVFEYKYGFTAGLSIIDLIFNLGPEAGEFLKRIS